MSIERRTELGRAYNDGYANGFDDGMNAVFAERTCHNASYRVDESRFHCSECGYGCWVKDVADGRDKLPSYCPNCGARVEGEA